MQRLFRSILVSAPLLVVQTAFASPEFPSVIESELAMSCPPSCVVCHTTDPGQDGTAEQPLAFTLVGLGLAAADEGSLKDALAQLGAADSDDDGFTDVAELQAQIPSSPNDPALTPNAPGGGVCDAQINYGCGATIASRAPSRPNWVWLGLALAGALGIAARRRSGRAPR